ncbi:oxalate:formate antiporter [Salinigranum rubrum]|uniref:Oxalate:formate antiporter n=1 Tax=Salinigranum rubrum TaxID=755307 RepID=A0A2I8VL92_9EURY|nr:MFS transporter [Salinigranum rubrum]AUV82696.1 oxalate:formate antiporter [Salinigranum rubrum]
MGRLPRRWLVVLVAALLMGLAGTYQFVWSSLSGAVASQFPAASDPALGTVFTLFVVAQTLAQFPAGRIRDRYGPRNVLLVAAGCLFAGYAGVGLAPSFPVLAFAYALGGVGAGVAYTVAVNTPVKWIPAEGRRGLATGLVTMAYSGTSVFFIPILRGSLDDAFTTTLLALGGVVGVGGLLGAWVIRDPDRFGADEDHDADRDADASDSGAATNPTHAVGWRTAVRTWQFWVLYVVMIIINGVGLMLVGQSVGFAAGLGLSAPVATTVASAIALGDGAGVLLISGLSDRFGGERTVGVSLVLCGCALAAGVFVGARGLAIPFILLVAAAAFFRSPVFGIFPTLVAEYYGAARSSENYAAVYSAKIPGGVVGGTVAGALVVTLGWSRSFYLGAALLVFAGVAALALRPVSLDTVGSAVDVAEND